MRQTRVHRCAVLLGKGCYPDEIAGADAAGGPRAEFVAIAKATSASVFSFASARARRAGVFARLFDRRPLAGAVADFVLAAGRYDRCYVTGEDVGLLAALALRARGWRGKLICVVHNVTPRKARLFRWVGNRIFSALIVVSDRQARALMSDCRIPPEKVIRVHNWVDDQFFKPSGDGADRPFTFMACGAENRDYPTLIAAARRLDLDFEVYAHGFFGENAGQGTGADHPGNVRRMPRVPFSELASAYRLCGAVVVPLNPVDYAAGVTGLVEAMASGKPVVTTRTAGLIDYLDAIETEAQVRPGDVDDMIRALSAIAAQSDDARIATGRRHRAWVERHCSLDGYVGQVKRLMLTC